MSDADLRPPDARKPSVAEDHSLRAPVRWWDPLTTKWGIVGLIVFIGLAFGFVQSVKDRVFPPVVTADNMGSHISEMEAACRKIENFAERTKCEKPIEEWRAQQRARHEAIREAERAKNTADERNEAAYQAHRESLKFRARLRQQFVDLLAKGRSEVSDRQSLEKTIADWKTLLGRRIAFMTHQPRAALEYIDLMPFENGASLIINYATDADEGAIKESLVRVRLDMALGKPDLIGELGEGKDKRPLFPIVPTARPAKFGDLPRKAEPLSDRRDIHRAIGAIYRDCEEHYRPLYTQHLKTLVESYIAKHTTQVETVPQPDLFVQLEGAVTPNDRLDAALALLREGKLTPLALQRIRETPEAIFAQGCPPDRRQFQGRPPV